MRQYIDIVKRVLETGVHKHPVRFDSHVDSKDGKPAVVANATIGLPCVVFEHDMRDGFPLLTTKKVAWRAVRVELEGFIRGITSKEWYQKNGCHVWDQWCNPQRIPAHIRNDRDQVEAFMKTQDDLGPIYGSQWRNFSNSGYDQLKVIAERLRENPYDRRMVCSAWAPQDMPNMALPPCHLIWNVIVYGDTLNLWWGQRSCDLMLGVPFNIASYALLLSLLARHAGLKPGRLTGLLGDCHIYENQIEAAKTQAAREPNELPELSIVGEPEGIFDWKWSHAGLVNYMPLPAIDFGKVTVT